MKKLALALGLALLAGIAQAHNIAQPVAGPASMPALTALTDEALEGVVGAESLMHAGSPRCLQKALVVAVAAVEAQLSPMRRGGQPIALGETLSGLIG